MPILRISLCILYLAAFPGYAQESIERYDAECLPLHRAAKHGPFDYNKATLAERHLVERPHFDEHYQAYRLGKGILQKKTDHIIETPAAGFSYTLWAFPNHPLALAAMEDIAFKQKKDTPPGAQLKVHCYFQRAVRFTPEDPLVRSLYGYYYARRGKKQEAMMQLAKAESLDSGIADVAVYSAFAYFEISEFNKSLEAAKQAYQLGYQLPGLRNKLERAGKWKD
ncbi:MAG: hypothetical protein LBE81_01420 [Azonexus sp.]|jgi:predicted Zn-dependent protease|uniref:hypothetical protein n=1 Tax=Azonexus sp. TaxID=1872668 RepID=UPI00282A8273|nr:hypothetical protein [Azonexus sp.]MDR0775286.1 hypothetical protein [Azonexus sp.]